MNKPAILTISLVFLSIATVGAPQTADKPAPTPKTPAAGVADPSAVYCADLGYGFANGDCVFPDGTHCPTWHFYRGKCGQEWSFCAKRGGRMEGRDEDRGTWTAAYGVCVFEDGSECGEQEFFDGACGPGDCSSWTSAKGCEPTGSAAPRKTELPGEWKKHRNAAHYQKGDWSHLLYTKKRGSAESCAQTCWDDPSCTFFFINERGPLVLESLGDKGGFARGECVFFSGKLWAASAPQSDTYVKIVPASPGDKTIAGHDRLRTPLKALATESVQYGQVELRIEDRDVHFEIRVMSDQELLETWVLDSSHFDLNPRALDPLIFSLCDANKDGLDDLLVNDVKTVGAGPKAGMVYSNYRLFLQEEGEFQKHDIDLTQFAETRDPHRVIEYLDRAFGQEDPLPLIGVKPDGNGADYLLKDDERLVFGFRMQDSEKSLTVAIEEDHEYLVYRFGRPDRVELEHLAPRGDQERRFRYYSEENYGYRRYRLTYLSFSVAEYRYSVYENYIEGQREDPEGIGVRVTNTSTGKVTVLPGDRATKIGRLNDLELLDWLEKKEVRGRDYEDER